MVSSRGPQEADPALNCVDFLQGLLVGIVGKVGCGKSSLLAAIAGELHR